MHTNRRTFVKSLVAAGVAGSAVAARAAQPAATILFGVCTGPDQAAKLKDLGYDFIEGSVANLLKPAQGDAEWAPQLANLRACALPIRSCNGFIPSTFKLTGPNPSQDGALEYAVTACRRADLVGIPFIVLGSGSARRVPAGFDAAKAKAQFIDFCQKLGDRIKDLKVTIVLEPLNKDETNLLNSVAEGIEYVDAIKRDRIRLLADFYHMLKEGESPDAIRKAGARIRHCHIAELDGRTAPGTKGEDLGGFFKALKDIGYAGGVSCECKWPDHNLDQARTKALATMRAQAGG